MSTRCIAIFREDGEVFATIYRHCDGYPSCMGSDLAGFLKDARPGWTGLAAANFVARLNGKDRDCLELHPEIRFKSLEEFISYMVEKTDWLYAYLIDSDRKNFRVTVIYGDSAVLEDAPVDEFEKFCKEAE